PRKLLVFYRADRFPHQSIPEWNKMLELLGEKTGAYRATFSQNYDSISPDGLKPYDAVFFNNTCGMSMPESAKAAIEQYVRSGKGYAGNHGAGDTWHDWPPGLAMIGAEFAGHPFSRIQVKVDDPHSPLTAVFGGKPFPFSDEIYAFRAPYSRDKLRVLLSIDYPNSPHVQQTEEAMRKKGDKAAAPIRADHDYAVSWIHRWGEGRVFYCSLGHRNEVVRDPAMIRFYLAGIQYALGDLRADDTPALVSQ
ncbi:MAG TPA: ThuA domain-containing protein, partial [Pirellulales bacterium]|nr:ThuA domain-containing protein [Pirellulales bacterium]